MTLRSSAKKLAYLAGLTASVSLASLMISPKANAVTYTLFTDTSSFNPQLTELNGTPTLTLNKYTPKAGETVTEVDFTLTGNLTSQGNIVNTASGSNSFTVKTFVDQFDIMQAQDPNASLLVGLPSSTLIASVKYTSVPSNTSLAFGPATKSISSIATFINSSDIAQFLGSGTYNLYPYTGISTSIVGGGGNVTTSINTYAGATLTVNYIGTKATTVPFEFSSDSVIIPCAGTLVGISLLKRKRQRAET